MRILLVHQNFPAQFLRLAPWLVAQGHQVVFLTKQTENQLPGVHKAYFAEKRQPADTTHAYLRESVEGNVLQGQAACVAAHKLKQQGFIPDVIYGHSGFGSAFYLKDVFPNTPLVNYFEWFYHAHGTDLGFDPAEEVMLNDECRVRTKNMGVLQDLYSCDAGICPTYWQHSQFPVEYRGKLRVVHDGIDTAMFCPEPQRKVVLPELQLDLSAVEEVITYVGRGMEPQRGFMQFMEAVSLLLKRRPNCHVVIVGADRVAYGPQPTSGKSYKQMALEQFSCDEKRLHFTGILPYVMYRNILQASTVHVYLTRPFILSWSMLEAMSCGCTIVASDTAPVREVIQDGENGLLCDFFAPQQLADRMVEALDDKQRRSKLGAKARETIVNKYNASRLLPQHWQVLQGEIGRRS